MKQDEITPLPFTPKFHVLIRDGEWQLMDGLRAGRSSLIFNLAVDEARAIKHAGHSVHVSPMAQLASEIDSLHNMEIISDSDNSSCRFCGGLLFGSENFTHVCQDRDNE